jgi:RNA-directed DNA polymerase
MLNRTNFDVAFRALRKKASAGVDGVTCSEYEKSLQGNLADLKQRLKEKRYRAKLVKRVFIPKSNGKLRPLGIPALEDKIVQYVVRENFFGVIGNSASNNELYILYCKTLFRLLNRRSQ